jgi:hypothetical protein
MKIEKQEDTSKNIDLATDSEWWISKNLHS